MMPGHGRQSLFGFLELPQFMKDSREILPRREVGGVDSDSLSQVRNRLLEPAHGPQRQRKV
jgi:hypothetical protein